MSSTYVDLSEVRADIIRWLTGIFGVSLVVMETSGSDTAPPNITSVRRVRQCDFFIGVYAHRYGTIDASTGRSITELELDEARSAHSTGVVSELLLYQVDPNSSWLSEFADATPEANAGRERLRTKLHHHTYTTCRNETELLFSIVRDVYHLIAQRFFSDRRALRPYTPPSARPIRRPFGMEFLTSGDAEYLIGREDSIQDCITQLQTEPIVLLLGESGIGKTSLIHAGIIPRMANLGWRPIYTRPLGMPCTDVVDQIEASAFIDGIRHAPLLQTVAELVSALGDVHLLLVIDQFEDVLNSSSTDNLEELLSGLGALRELSEPRLHILISYRADLEGRLGTLWQRISGSARGLARVYIGGLKVDGFWKKIASLCEELKIELHFSDAEAQRVTNDLMIASRNWAPSKLYPPYVQMLIDFMFSAGGLGRQFTFQTYQNAGGISGIVRDYLSKQLRLAQEDGGDLRLLLIALVKSYGIKAQRSLQELSADTGLDRARCEALLERLIDLRLARHISGLYEVSHDFLAKIILEELVDSEEREFKRFRELLSSRGIAFANTSNRLTVEEVLFLYKHKRRIIYSEPEAILLIDTWIKDDVPGLFWIKDFDRNVVERRLATYDDVNLEFEQQFRVARLKWLFSIPINDNNVIAIMKMYKGAHDAAAMLVALQRDISADAGLFGLKSRQGAIRNACSAVLSSRVKRGEWKIIDALYGSTRASYARLFFELVTVPSIPTLDRTGSRVLAEFGQLQRIARPSNGQSPKAALSQLKTMRPRKALVIFGEALLAIQQGRARKALRAILTSGRKQALPIIAATEVISDDNDFESLLQIYLKLNVAEIDAQRTPSASAKAEDLARIIRRLTTKERIAVLRGAVKHVDLKPSARDIVIALLTYGDADDVTAILVKIAEFTGQVYFQNHMELCVVAKQAMMRSAGPTPEELKRWVRSRNFWRYISASERKSVEPHDLLPIRNLSNRPLFIRLLAHAVVGCSRSNEDDLLRSFLHHDFTTIASAAAIRMAELAGDAALGEISTEIDAAISAGGAATLASAIRSAEESLYIHLFGTR